MLEATGAVQNDYSVEVNFLGKDLDPAAITAILGLDPTESALAGDRFHNGHSEGTYDEGFWTFEVSTRDDLAECRDHQLAKLIDRIEPYVNQLQAAGVERMYFYFTLSSYTGLMNIRLHPATLARLGNLGADLFISCFDCYNPKNPYWKQVPTLQSTDSQPS